MSTAVMRAGVLVILSATVSASRAADAPATPPPTAPSAPTLTIPDGMKPVTSTPVTLSVLGSCNTDHPFHTTLYVTAGQKVLIQPTPTDTWSAGGKKGPTTYRGHNKVPHLWLMWGIGSTSERVTSDHMLITAPVSGELMFSCHYVSAASGAIRVTISTPDLTDPTPTTVATTAPAQPATPPPAQPPAPATPPVVPQPKPPTTVATAASKPPPPKPSRTSRSSTKTDPTESPLARTQSTIRSLVVQFNKEGAAFGSAIDVIATANLQAPDHRVRITRNAGSDMTKSLDDAVRAIKVKHPGFERVHVDIDFSEKYSGKDGGSAAAAFGVLMLSLVEGFEIDPDLAMTGDLALNSKVLAIGAVAAKVRGGVLDKAKVIVIPESNAEMAAEIPLLYPKQTIWQAQLFSASNLDEVVAIARKDREPKLAEAMKAFAEVQAKLQADESGYLSSPECMQRLQEVVALAPNHLSAKHLLLAAQGRAPRRLTRTTSLMEVCRAALPVDRAIWQREQPSRTTLPATTVKAALDRMRQLQAIIDPDLQPLQKAYIAYIEACDKLAAGGAGNKVLVKTWQDKADAVMAAFNALQSDPKVMEKLIREGR